MYIQHSLSYAVQNFHLNWLTLLEAMTDVLGVHFLSEHSVDCQPQSVIALHTNEINTARTGDVLNRQVSKQAI